MGEVPGFPEWELEGPVVDQHGGGIWTEVEIVQHILWEGWSHAEKFPGKLGYYDSCRTEKAGPGSESRGGWPGAQPVFNAMMEKYQDTEDQDLLRGLLIGKIRGHEPVHCPDCDARLFPIVRARAIAGPIGGRYPVDEYRRSREEQEQMTQGTLISVCGALAVTGHEKCTECGSGNQCGVCWAYGSNWGCEECIGCERCGGHI